MRGHIQKTDGPCHVHHPTNLFDQPEHSIRYFDVVSSWSTCVERAAVVRSLNISLDSTMSDFRNPANTTTAHEFFLKRQGFSFSTHPPYISFSLNRVFLAPLAFTKYNAQTHGCKDFYLSFFIALP